MTIERLIADLRREDAREVKGPPKTEGLSRSACKRRNRAYREWLAEEETT